jgi:hypothetical protein
MAAPPTPTAPAQAAAGAHSIAATASSCPPLSQRAPPPPQTSPRKPRSAGRQDLSQAPPRGPRRPQEAEWGLLPCRCNWAERPRRPRGSARPGSRPPRAPRCSRWVAFRAGRGPGRAHAARRRAPVLGGAPVAATRPLVAPRAARRAWAGGWLRGTTRAPLPPPPCSARSLRAHRGCRVPAAAATGRRARARSRARRRGPPVARSAPPPRRPRRRMVAAPHPLATHPPTRPAAPPAAGRRRI